MLGTLNGALEVRGIKLAPEAIAADVTGINEERDRIPTLVEIQVAYRLRIPAGTRETVDRALERHATRCPTARSLEGAVRVTWSAEVEEEQAPAP